MTRAQVSRRILLQGAFLGSWLALAGLCGCSKQSRLQYSASKQLNIQNWADYIHPQVIDEFERRYGIEVVYDTFASNEGLLAKMQAGLSAYDIVVPTSYTVKVLKTLGLIKALDKERIPNFKHLMPRFQNSAFDPNCHYSIPYTWGSTGIGFNQTAFGRGTQQWPCDWDVFWLARLAGRMTLLDDARETIGMALKRRGLSYNVVEEAPLRQALSDLLQQKPLTMAYTSDQVIIHLSSGDSLASLVFSGDAYQAAKVNSDIKYVIPNSGTSIWVDSWCIPTSAPHTDNAYLWLNFMLDPEIAAHTANYLGYASPNQTALKLINSHLKEDKNLYPPDSILDKCEEIVDIGSAVFTYDKIWTELKCG